MINSKYIYIYNIFVYICIYIYIPIYILLQKENKEITRPNWRCGVGTPGPCTSEAPISGLQTPHSNPPCRSLGTYYSIRSRFSAIHPPFLSPFFPVLSFIAYYRWGHGGVQECERTRAGTRSFTEHHLSGVHVTLIQRGQIHQHVHAQSRTHART